MTDKNANTEIRKEFCPNCEAETPCTHEAELFVCDICGEDFAKYIVSRNCNVSDVSMTQDVSIDIKTPSSIENTNPDYYKDEGAGVSEQYGCPDCNYVEYIDKIPIQCPICGHTSMERLRWRKGGDGAHWEGCAEVHWDCRIARLEKVVKTLANKLLFHPVDYLSLQEYNDLVNLVQRTLRIDDFVGDSDHEHDDRIL